MCCYVILSNIFLLMHTKMYYLLLNDKKEGQLLGMSVFYCVVSNSLYHRVYLFIKFSWILVVLSMIIYEVLAMYIIRYNICSNWFLHIRISTYFYR